MPLQIRPELQRVKFCFWFRNHYFCDIHGRSGGKLDHSGCKDAGEDNTKHSHLCLEMKASSCSSLLKLVLENVLYLQGCALENIYSICPMLYMSNLHLVIWQVHLSKATYNVQGKGRVSIRRSCLRTPTGGRLQPGF